LGILAGRLLYPLALGAGQISLNAQGLFGLLRQFNSSMRDAFTRVLPRPAGLDMGLSRRAAPAPSPRSMVSAVAERP